MTVVSDERWQQWYARSQRRARRVAAQSDHDWPAAQVVALSHVRGVDGKHYRIRVVGPGESVDRPGLAALAGLSSAFATRGLWVARSSSDRSFVVVERQRGPFRDFEKLEQHPVLGPKEAAELVAQLRRQITSGRNSNPP